MPNVFGGTNFNIAPQNSSYRPDVYEEEAINTINHEKTVWDDENVYLTDRVSYMMRNVIKKARKFYYGIFDNPYDEVTGEDKTWVPLIEWSVESVVKSVDLDTKDVVIQPGKKNVPAVPVIRALLLNYMKKMGFGQLLNDSIRVLARDGTVVVKSFLVPEKGTDRQTIKSKIVDLLNIWIDPAVDSIHEAPAIIERSYMTEADMQEYAGVWSNLDAVVFSTNVPNIIDTWGTNRGRVPYMEVWERWGKIKKSWITKDPKDNDTWVEGHIVASGQNGANVIHVIRENPRDDGAKPYEECWYKRVDGRWYGRGISEMLFGLQEYANQVVNTRKANNMVLQNGIFLIRKGSGLTPDMISSMAAGGGLPVTDINRDVKQLQVQDYRQSSYTDEDRIGLYADRVTGAFDINRGEAGRASVSATATLTQDRNIRDTFVLVQEGIGFFTERLLIRQYIPLLKQIMKSSDVIRITGDPAYIAKIDDEIIERRLAKWEQMYVEKSGFWPSQGEIDDFRSEQKKQLASQGKQRFANYFKQMFDEATDIDVTITDERFNRVVAVQQLEKMLIAYSRLPVASRLDADAILGEIINLMGIRGEFFMKQPQIPVMGQDMSQVGRMDKQPLEGVPTEGTAFENAAGMPELGQSAPQITGGMEGGLPPGAPPPMG